MCLTNNPTLLVDMVNNNPIPLRMALTGFETSTLMCTQKGYMPIPLRDGTLHYQLCLINQHVADTIMSPEHILNKNHQFAFLQQEGQKVQTRSTTPNPGSLSFFDSASALLLPLPLQRQEGLYYCSHIVLIP